MDGVPAIIVNGQYRTSASQAGGNDQLMGVVTQLIEQESQAPSAEAGTPPAGNP